MELFNKLVDENAQDFSKYWAAFLFNIDQVRALGNLEADKAKAVLAAGSKWQGGG